MNHTPTPWNIQANDSGAFALTSGATQPMSRHVIARFDAVGCSHYSPDERHANVCFAQRACNAHEELVAALRRILEGNTMEGRENWTHADVIQEHYKIARKALTTIEKGA